MIIYDNFLYIVQSQKCFKTYVGHVLKWPNNIILTNDLKFDILIDKENNVLKHPIWKNSILENVLNKKSYKGYISKNLEERNQQLYKEFK